jgi:hypothetical protein
VGADLALAKLATQLTRREPSPCYANSVAKSSKQEGKRARGNRSAA